MERGRLMLVKGSWCTVRAKMPLKAVNKLPETAQLCSFALYKLPKKPDLRNGN